MSIERVTYKLGDADLILETGKIGKQANGCVYAQWGGAAIIATICASSAVTEGQDFVPVTVEYNEKAYYMQYICFFYFCCIKSQRFSEIC